MTKKKKKRRQDRIVREKEFTKFEMLSFNWFWAFWICHHRRHWSNRIGSKYSSTDSFTPRSCPGYVLFNSLLFFSFFNLILPVAFVRLLFCNTFDFIRRMSNSSTMTLQSLFDSIHDFRKKFNIQQIHIPIILPQSNNNNSSHKKNVLFCICMLDSSAAHHFKMLRKKCQREIS